MKISIYVWYEKIPHNMVKMVNWNCSIETLHTLYSDYSKPMDMCYVVEVNCSNIQFTLYILPNQHNQNWRFPWGWLQFDLIYRSTFPSPTVTTCSESD